MAAKFHVAGLKELATSLDDMKKSTAKNVVRRGLRKALQPVADHAKDLVREDSGALKGSIKVGAQLTRKQKSLHRARRDAVHIFVGAGGLTQAVTEEYGTIDQAPHPYMRPAWDAHADKVMPTAVQEINVEIDKAKKRAERRAARAKAKAIAAARANR
ncbi:HK97-gp10 family putative phage morphogenesis protein [Aquibaculum sediminis]|uniref:HK97-gp10 family putative phage morphogenesis protein n=1 Tax=Aquibaculum sediminis TaxID=3231907 RepID=UPI003454CC0E